MTEVIWPVLGVLVSGALLVWFWRPRRRSSDKAPDKHEDPWKAMDDGADPTE